MRLIRDYGFFIIFAVFIVVVLFIGHAQFNESIKCNDKGGVYLTGKGMFPVCVKAETL